MRWVFWMYPIPIVIVGCFVFMYTDSFGPRYFSLFLVGPNQPSLPLAHANTILAELRVRNELDDIRVDSELNPTSTSEARRCDGFHEQHRQRSIDLDAFHVLGQLAATLSSRARDCDWSDVYSGYNGDDLAVLLGFRKYVCPLFEPSSCATTTRMAADIAFSLDKRFERNEMSDSEPTEKDMKKLQKTAEMEGVDIATARQMQKGEVVRAHVFSLQHHANLAQVSATSCKWTTMGWRRSPLVVSPIYVRKHSGNLYCSWCDRVGHSPLDQ